MNIKDIDGAPRTRWIALRGPLDGIEVLIRCATPLEAQKFHNKLRREGITRPNGAHPFDTADGMERHFFERFAAMYVLDWRDAAESNGTAKAKVGGDYDAKQMGIVLGAYRSAFDAVFTAVTDEASFFGHSENGQT